MNKDILLYETGDGGDLLISNNDMTLVDILFQQAYILMFGGNYEENTTGSEIESQERNDWWGNSLFFNENPSKQFNSNTERVLDNVVLNTSGRLDIKRAVEFDLKSLKKLANFDINVIILSTNKIAIEIKLIKPNNLEDKTLQFIWNNATKEIIIDRTI